MSLKKGKRTSLEESSFFCTPAVTGVIFASRMGSDSKSASGQTLTVLQDLSGACSSSASDWVGECERGGGVCERESRLRDILACSADWIWEVDSTGHYTYCSSRIKDVLGYAPAEVIGRTPFDFMSPEEATRVGEIFKNIATASAPIVDLENTGLHKDGHEVRLLTNGHPITDSSGRLLGYRGVDKDITERHKGEQSRLAYTRELEGIRLKLENQATELIERSLTESRAREASEAALSTRSHFMDNMSHELRTPMNGILGMSDLLLDTSLDAEQTEYLKSIRESADTLLETIDNLLELSNIQTGEIQLQLKHFKLRSLVTEILIPFQRRAEEKEILLTADIENELPDYLIGDSPQLRHVLENLIGNALKFTPRGGNVVLMLRRDPVDIQLDNLAVRFIVSDTGVGIPTEKLQEIFEAFTQVDLSHTRQHGGTGVGLTISQKIIEMMGGALEVKSRKGLGTSFRFTLRFGRSNEAICSASDEVTADDRLLTSTPLRVLLVEDNPSDRRYLQKLLEKQHAKVETVSNGREALRLITQRQDGAYDLLLMDVEMPELDGCETTRAVRAQESELGVRSIIIGTTAYAQRDERTRGLEAGMDEYLVKPIRAARLLKAINACLLRNSHK